MTAKPPVPEETWAAIHLDYQAGVLSLREICVKHDGVVTESGIRKRASRDGWVRDLAGKIKGKAEDLVRKAAVAVRNTGAQTGAQSVTPSEQAVVDANATAIANVRLEHRVTIRRGRTLVDALFAELEHQTANPDVYVQLLQVVCEGEDGQGKQALRQAFHKAMAVGNRISAFARLTEGMKNVVTLERQAWGLDDLEKPAEDLRNLTDDELMSQATDLYAKHLASSGQD